MSECSCVPYLTVMFLEMYLSRWPLDTLQVYYIDIPLCQTSLLYWCTPLPDQLFPLRTVHLFRSAAKWFQSSMMCKSKSRLGLYLDLSPIFIGNALWEKISLDLDLTWCKAMQTWTDLRVENCWTCTSLPIVIILILPCCTISCNDNILFHQIENSNYPFYV